MSVQNAGLIIREARIKAGLSQEKLSEGVCSALSLSRIETGAAGVSPSTFQALMAHAGAPCEVFPIFASRADFDCFYTLKRARFYLDCWQLKEAYEELEKIEERNFTENKYYYQEWLLLHCRLQFCSGCGKHKEIYDTLSDALHISRPEIDFSDFRDLLLSLNEIELLTAIAQESLYLNDLETCLAICTQISTYLENSQITFFEKDRLLAGNAVVYSKYLIATHDYPAALKTADTFRLQMIANVDSASLHELTFLTGLGYYYIGNTDEALICFKTAFFSAHSVQSCYATTIRHYISETLGISLFDRSFAIEDIPLVSYAVKQAINTAGFSDGTYDLFSPDVLTLGSLIRELRMEQNLSQQTLCYGLCSKSRLSKIENGTLQPDIALAQTLLQRLGLSDTVFTFYGNEHEFTLQNLRLHLSQTRRSDKSNILNYTDEMRKLCSDKDWFYIQYASYKRACLLPDNAESVNALFHSLSLSVPNFNFNNMHNYCLSWLELTILNNYCDAYCYTAPSKGTLYLYKMLEYYDCSNLDILEKKRIFPILIAELSAVLYRQKRFSELVELTPYLSLPVIKSSLYFIGEILGNYSQALGEVQQIDKIFLFANYAYYNLLIKNSIRKAEFLKNDIYTDFNIILA